MISDEVLLQQIGNGDSKAFGSLFERYKKAVFGLALHMMGAAALAEEVAQETWVSVVKEASAYTGRGAVKSWIFAMTRNRCLNELKKRKWEQPMEEDQLNNLPAEEISDPAEYLSELQEDLKEAILLLPDKQRCAVVLSLHEENSLSDIAKHMDMKVNAVKATLFRAKQNLKELLIQKKTARGGIK